MNNVFHSFQTIFNLTVLSDLLFWVVKKIWIMIQIIVIATSQTKVDSPSDWMEHDSFWINSESLYRPHVSIVLCVFKSSFPTCSFLLSFVFFCCIFFFVSNTHSFKIVILFNCFFFCFRKLQNNFKRSSSSKLIIN